MASQIRVIIDALWEGRNKTRQARDDLQDIGKAGDNTGRSLKDVGTVALAAGATIAGAALTAREAWQQLGEGAELIGLEKRFDRAAESIGTTGDMLLDKLDTITRNTQTDAALMQGSFDLISQGLVGTQSEAVQLGRLVGELDWDLQTLGQTLNNQSLMRVDSLKLAASRVDELRDKYVALGVASEQAFRLAIIEAGNEALETYGSQAEGIEGDMASIEASLGNIVNTTKELAALEFAPALGQISEQIELFGRLAELREKNIISQERLRVLQLSGLNPNYLEGLEREIEALEGSAHAQAIYADEAMIAERIARESAASRGDLAQATEELWSAEARGRREARAYADQMQVFAGRTNQAAEEVWEWTDAGKAAADAGQFWMESNAGLASQLGGNFIQALDGGIEGSENYIDVMLRSAAANGATRESLGLLAGATGLYSDSQIEAALNTSAMIAKAEQLGAAVAAGDLTVQQAIESFRNFQDELNKPYEVKVEADTDEALGRIEEVNIAADNAAGNRYIDFYIRTIGGVPETSGPGQSGIPYAAGTDGIERVPGPPGRPFPVVLHGGEDFWVGQRGEAPPARGGDTYYYNYISPNINGRQSALAVAGRDAAQPWLDAAQSLGVAL